MVFHRFFHQLWYFIGFFPQNIVFHRFFHRYFIRFSPKHMVFHRFSMVLIHPYAINFTDEAMQIKVFYSPDASVELSDTTLRELWSRGLQCWRQLGVEMMDRRIIWFGDARLPWSPSSIFIPLILILKSRENLQARALCWMCSHPTPWRRCMTNMDQYGPRKRGARKQKARNLT